MLEEPDKGYAWVVLCGACVINALLSGMARMIGLLYVALIDAYGVTRREASRPFTLRNAVRYFAAPLAGVLGQMYGIRDVTFLGGVVAAAGSILCAFAPTVDWIVFFWGVIHGVGFALSNTLFQVVVNQYFERHRASASGLVLSGACVGALLFPLMIEATLDSYGLFGCFLLLGGLFLNVLPPALLLKSPPWIQFPEAYARHRARLLNKSDESKCLSKTPSGKPAEEYNSVKQNPNGHTIKFGGKDDITHPPNVVCTIYRSFDSGKTRQNTFQAGMDNAAYVPGPDENDCEKKPVAAPPKKKAFLQTVGEIPGLYSNPVYILISVSVATYFGSILPITAVIVDYSRDKGIPISAEKFLIYSLTIGDLLGRLCFGWVTDRGHVSLPRFMTLTYLLKGATLLLLTMTGTLLGSGVVLGLYGVGAGVAMVYFPILVHRYVPPENQNIGMGCMGLVSGVATFGLPPLIGYFRDQVGSYDGMFYILAAVCAATGALWLWVPLYEKRREGKKRPLT